MFKKISVTILAIMFFIMPTMEAYSQNAYFKIGDKVIHKMHNRANNFKATIINPIRIECKERVDNDCAVFYDLLIAKNTIMQHVPQERLMSAE